MSHSVGQEDLLSEETVKDKDGEVDVMSVSVKEDQQGTRSEKSVEGGDETHTETKSEESLHESLGERTTEALEKDGEEIAEHGNAAGDSNATRELKAEGEEPYEADVESKSTSGIVSSGEDASLKSSDKIPKGSESCGSDIREKDENEVAIKEGAEATDDVQHAETESDEGGGIDGKEERSEKEKSGGADSETDEQSGQHKLMAETGVRSSRRKTRKSAGEEQKQVKSGEDEEEKAAQERRRSLRSPKQISYSDTRSIAASSGKGEKSTAKRSPKKVVYEKALPAFGNTPISKATDSATRRTRRSQKEIESPIAESTTTPKRGSQSKAGPSKRAPMSEGANRRRNSGPSKRSGSDDDPFSLESNFDNHPQPLRNIQMERQSFGNIKYTKASSTPDTSSNRYEKTEQTASERRSNLSDLVPQLKHGVVHKSLSELSTIRRTSRKSKKVGSAGESVFADGADSDKGEEPMGEDAEHEAANGENLAVCSGLIHEVLLKASLAQIRAGVGELGRSELRIKRMKTVVPVLSVDEQFAVDHRENEHAPYEIGTRVYALWGREYYAAKVSAERDSSGRYELLFVEDEQVRRLVITGIIPLTALTAGKKCVTTTKRNGDEVIEEVEVVNAPSSVDKQQWMEAIFHVKSVEHGDEYSVTWEKVVLSANQASDLVTAKVNTACDVMADNIDSAEARRSRAARHTHAPEDATPTRAVRTSKKLKDGRKKEGPAAVEADNESISAGTGVGTATSANPAREGGDIFSGIAVVVTSAMRKNKDEEQAFSKREVRQMIENHGGMVSDDFTKIPPSEKVLLIADTHYRTHKYLSALARSVPCVRHQWIRDCVDQNKLLEYDDYMLPAGVSLLTNKIVPWHANNGQLLEGKRVLLSTRNFYPETQMPNFSEIWAPLIQQMGATVVDRMPPDGVDILLTDASCPDEVLAEARSFNAIIVSSEWIIQSIIHGSLPDPTAHERFQYNFVDSQ
ncbi:Tumor suppressor p53-binding protein 1 [Toxocara canis]|uniref:Tumor suppressor p53-binding protein 1 n=1 Tax=Toxocara canis TaxID=6265 RepID=A0A0B2UQX8_TOXCA|nr:Tumor suppressor p53-binding protein 1 [Toxocara canis]